MAKLPFFVMVGSSQMNGFGSTLSTLSTTDLARWIGVPLFPTTTPATVTVPGIKLWQAKMPFAANSVRNITDVPTTSSVEFDGAAIGATDVGRWVYIASNTTGEGQAKRITAQAGNSLTVSAVWSPTLSADGTMRIITGSHSVGALTVLAGGTADAGGSTSTLIDAALTELDDAWNGLTVQFTSGANSGLTREIVDFIAATDTIVFHPAVTAAVGAGDTYNILQSTKVVVKDTTSGSFPGADVGRWVSVSGQFRKITAVATVGATQAITLDNVLSVAQAANDPIYVLDGATTADTLANFAQGAAFRDFQFFLDSAPVFFTGFDYCNYTQNAPSAPPATTTTTLINCLPELMTQLRYRFTDTIYGFELGIDSTQAAPQFIGTSLQALNFGWKHDVTHLDFHPSNAAGILAAALTGIASAQALAVAQGDTLDPQGIFFIGMMENDTLDVQKLAHLGENMTLIRDKLRTALGSQRVPCIILGCSPTSVTLPNHDEDADRASANAQALQMKLDDPWTGFIPTPNAAFVKQPDQLHYTPAGHVAIAQAAAIEWDAIRQRANDAARLLAELPTLASIRTRVRRRYERTDSGNSLLASRIDMFVNDSLSEIVNTLGDSAWFQRRVERIALDTVFPGTMTLPRQCRRIIRIEREACPGQAVVYKGLSYTDEGRVQITLHNYSGGPFVVHFISQHQELVNDTDVALVPAEHVELIVMLTCKRIAENSGNAAVAQYYMIETERLWRCLKREALRYDRFRQGQLEGVGAYDAWRGGSYPGPLEGI